MKLQGYAALFDEVSEPLGGFRERFARGAFADSLRNADVVLLHGHDSGKPLARMSAGNLTLREDQRGLWFEATLPDTANARELHTLVEARVMESMSFGFGVQRAEDEFWEETDSGELLRTVKRARLLEISPVTWAAYPATTVEARGKAPAKAEAKPKAKGKRQAAPAKEPIHARRKRMAERLAAHGDAVTQIRLDRGDYARRDPGPGGPSR